MRAVWKCVVFSAVYIRAFTFTYSGYILEMIQITFWIHNKKENRFLYQFTLSDGRLSGLVWAKDH